MSIAVSQVSNQQSFGTWLQVTNYIADIISTTAVTTNNSLGGSFTTGNAFVNGVFGSNTLKTTYLGGGNVSTNTVLTITTNTSISGYLSVGNSSVNVFSGWNSSGNTLLNINGSVNNHVKVTLTNANTQSSAGADVVIYDDKGITANNFVDIGINSTTWSNTFWTISGVSDGHVYTGNTNLAIGTAGEKSIRFFSNGTLATNEVMRLTSGANVGIGNTNPNAKLQVTGTANISGNMAVLGPIIGSNTLSLTGSATFSNVVTVVGNAALNKSLTVTGNATFSNQVTIIGNTVMSNNMTVAGNSTLSGTLELIGAANLQSSANIAGTLGVNAAATLANTLSVTGLVTGLNGLDVTGITNTSVSVNVGANVNLTTTKINIGNSSINAVANSTAIRLNANSTDYIQMYSTDGVPYLFANSLSNGSSTILPGSARYINNGNNTHVPTSTYNGNGIIIFTTDSTDFLINGSPLKLSNLQLTSNTLSITRSWVNTSVVIQYDNITIGNTTSNTFVNSTSITAAGIIAITGNATFSNQVTITGNVALSNTLAITGNANFANTIEVSGIGTFNRDLYVTGNVGIANTSPTDKLRVEGNIGVSGNVYSNNGYVYANNLMLYGNGTHGYIRPINTGLDSSLFLGANNSSIITIFGNGFTSSISTINALSFRATDDFIANAAGVYHTGTINAASHTIGTTLVANTTSLTYTNAVSFSNTLLVTGATTLSENTTFSKAINVTGNSIFTDSIRVNIVNAVTSVGIGGSANVATDLRVGGDLIVAGRFSFASYSTGDLVPVSNSYALGNTTSRWTLLANSGNFVNTVSVLGNTTLLAELSLIGNANFSNCLIVVGNSALSNTLVVTGATTLSNTLAVTGATTLTGAAALSNTITVTGNTTLSKSLIVTGNTTLSNTINVVGAAILSNTLSVAGDVTLTSNAAVKNLAVNNSIVIQNSSGANVVQYTANSTVFTTLGSDVVIDSLDAAVYRSAEYTIQMVEPGGTSGRGFHTTKIMIMNDGSDSYLSEYGTVVIGRKLAIFKTDINAGAMRLIATANSAVAVVKFQRSSIVV